MAYKVTVRVGGKCPKHIRYNPEKQGEGAIKSGCAFCSNLAALHRRVVELRAIQKVIDTSVLELKTDG